MALIFASLLDPFLVILIIYVLVKGVKPKTAALLGGGLFAFQFFLMIMNPLGPVPALVLIKAVIDPGALALAAFVRMKLSGDEK